MNPITMTEKAMDAQTELLIACAAMLETYVPNFPANRGTVKFTEADMKAWKEKFYPALVEGGPQLPDNLFFDPSGKQKNMGIGSDGAFSSVELFQFLYRLYKHLYGLKAVGV